MSHDRNFEIVETRSMSLVTHRRAGLTYRPLARIADVFYRAGGKCAR